MRILDQISALGAVADGGEGVGGWEYGFVGQRRGQDLRDEPLSELVWV